MQAVSDREALLDQFKQGPFKALLFSYSSEEVLMTFVKRKLCARLPASSLGKVVQLRAMLRETYIGSVSMGLRVKIFFLAS